MKIFIPFITALMLIILSSCSSLPSKEEMDKEVATFNLPHETKKDKGVIYIVRPGVLGGLVRFNVFLDDKEDDSEMGWNRSNEYFYFYASEGPHKIYSKAENWEEIEINVDKDKPIYIEQESRVGIIMARNALFQLDETKGKYYIKNLSNGKTIKTEKTK